MKVPVKQSTGWMIQEIEIEVQKMHDANGYRC